MLLFLSLSRFQCEEAHLGIKYGVYKGMYPYLKRARELLPDRVVPFLCQGDLQRIHTGLGKIWYERGREAKVNKVDRYADMMQSHEHYIKAIAINPHDILAVQGIAETVAELEFTFPVLFPGKENPYDALPLFERMAQVEPNGLDSNYAHAGYLHKKGFENQLLIQVQHSAKIFPSYGKIKNMPFYASAMREAVKSGLKQAIDENIMVRSAFFSLSRLYEEEEKYAEAAILYKNGMEAQKDANTGKQYFKLGTLFLKSGNLNQAYRTFVVHLGMSPKNDKNIRNIFSSFKKEKKIAEFIEFSKVAQANSIAAASLKLYVARAHIEQNNYEIAKETLQELITQKPSPEAYCLLAEVARKEKDWDVMELSIQKATVLDPRNGKYFSILADALLYQKKYRPAAEYMQKALANDIENKTYRKKLNKIRSYY